MLWRAFQCSKQSIGILHGVLHADSLIIESFARGLIARNVPDGVALWLYKVVYSKIPESIAFIERGKVSSNQGVCSIDVVMFCCGCDNELLISGTTSGTSKLQLLQPPPRAIRQISTSYSSLVTHPAIHPAISFDIRVAFFGQFDVFSVDPPHPFFINMSATNPALRHQVIRIYKGNINTEIS
jgi:hypothetical protein